MKLALTKVIRILANVRRITAKSKLGKTPTMVRTFAITKGVWCHHKGFSLVAKKNVSGARITVNATQAVV